MGITVFSPKYDVQKYYGLLQSGIPLARIQRTHLTVCFVSEYEEGAPLSRCAGPFLILGVKAG